MMQSSLAAAGRDTPRPSPPIQFYSVQITPLAGGGISVDMSATTCESLQDDDFELVTMDATSARVATIDEALAVIRDVVAATMQN